jgi:iron-sulfur cluster repair protein YtfE (RIC family)
VRENLVDLLLECHQRIRSFTALAREIGDQSHHESEEVRNACLSVIRYFTQALPLHVNDEEQSLLPRLIGKDAEVDSTLAVMQAQHTDHQRPIERMVAICSDLARPSANAAELSGELRPIAESIEREFIKHLELEESVIFPAIALHLSADEQAAIVRELRARRQSKAKPPLDH